MHYVITVMIGPLVSLREVDLTQELFIKPTVKHQCLESQDGGGGKVQLGPVISIQEHKWLLPAPVWSLIVV